MLKLKLVNAWRSLTIWFNGILLVATPMIELARTEFTALQDYLPANFYKSLMLTIIVGNILLRFKTTKSLAEK